MQGLADGYFVLPYTIGDYLSNEIRTGKISTETPEFEEGGRRRCGKTLEAKLLGILQEHKSVDYYP